MQRIQLNVEAPSSPLVTHGDMRVALRRMPEGVKNVRGSKKTAIMHLVRTIGAIFLSGDRTEGWRPKEGQLRWVNVEFPTWWGGEYVDRYGKLVPEDLDWNGYYTPFHYTIVSGHFEPVAGVARRARRAGTTPRTRRALARQRRCQ